MKPRTIILHQLLLAATDAAMVATAFLCGYLVRFRSGLIPLFHEVPPLTWYTRPLLLVIFIYLVFFRSVGLYAIRRPQRPLEELGAIVHGTAVASLVLIALTFFYRDVSYSRVYALLAGWGFTTAFVAGGRWGLRRAAAAWWPSWQRVPRLLILGTGPAATQLVQRLRGVKSRRVIGALCKTTETAGPPLPGIPTLGHLGELSPLLATRVADEVVLAEPDLPRPQILDLILQCEQEMVTFRMVPDLLGLLTTHVGVQNLDGIPLLGLRETPLSDPWNRFLKGAMDYLLAGTGVILTTPLWVAIVLLVKWDSPGPVFYLQERVGQDGRLFQMIKFRTMRTNAEAETGPVWTSPDDARRTRAGRWLRRWNLDELPQLLNVLRRDMSLVGPRPERPHFVRQFKQDIPRYMARHRVRSGITGWAQIHGLRGDTSIEERTQCDLYYLENWSLWLDCKILLKSLSAVKNAY